jgi:cell fate regulator YaaT (PSP1 superfamily)
VVLNTLPNGDSAESGGGCGNGEPCGTGLEKIYPTTAVRFGQMRQIGEFSRPADMKFGCGARVVVQTKRGIEIGDQVSLSCDGCSDSVSRDQILEYVARSGAEYYELECGRILRLASEQDLADYERINADGEKKHRYCQELASRHNLDIRVVSCEHLFGGERIIFYFLAEGRVDFRSLVKDLAREYQTRIEMRQIGARDEARLVADYETCGRECCCRNFLKNLKPVSMKMAKLQKATLDPSKVSGRCGRLKCCLRYEHTGYEDLDRRLPRIGADVRTRHGDGRVVARQILTQLIQIETSEGGRLAVAVEDVLRPGEPAEPQEAKEPGSEERPAAQPPQEDLPVAGEVQGGAGGRRRRKKRTGSSRAGDSSPQTESTPRSPGDAPEASTAEPPAASPATSAPSGGSRRRRKRRAPRNRRGAAHGSGNRDADAAPGTGKGEAGRADGDATAPPKRESGPD